MCIGWKMAIQNRVICERTKFATIKFFKHIFILSVTRLKSISSAECYNVLCPLFEKNEYYIPLELESNVLSP